MKIVFLADDVPPKSFGGAGISTFELARAMQKAGEEVFVVTTTRHEEEAGHKEFEGIPFFSIATNYNERWRHYLSLYNPKAIKALKKILKELQPDIVHVNNVHFYLSYHSIKIAKQYAKAVVFTARDVMAFNFSGLRTKRYLERFDHRATWLDHVQQAKKRWNPLRNFFIRRYLQYPDKRFAVSEALKTALEQNGIHGFEVMHTGIDASVWSVREEEVGAFRKKYGLEDKKVMFFGGRLTEIKGGGKAIEALQKIMSEIPDVVLLIAGKKDEWADAMLKKAVTLGVEDRVIFTGWMSGDDLKAAYRASDIVLVITLFFDSLPRVALEGMVSHKAVIGTRYGGTKEAVEDGKTGYIVNPFHAEEIAEKAIELFKDPKKRLQFGEAGFQRVQQEFNLDKKVAETRKIYQELCAAKYL